MRFVVKTVFVSTLLCTCVLTVHGRYCLPGKHQYTSYANPFNPEEKCDECATGRYSLGGYNVETCTRCPVGTANPDTQSTSADACLNCTAGKYSSSQGAAYCVWCIAGTYSLVRADICTTCDAGTRSSAISSTCWTCTAGTYS